MKSRANKFVFNVKPYVAGKSIVEVKRELGLTSVIKLASNENPYGPSPKVLKAIAGAAKMLNRYPDGSCFELRKEVAKHLKVEPEQLVFGNGSDECILMAIRAFVDPGDEVVIAKPSFLMYSIASNLAGARLVEVPLKGLRYNLEAMKRAVTPKTKIVFIGNPDNPSGQYPTRAEINTFLDGLQGVVVFLDEAYFEFASGDKGYTNGLTLLSKNRNVVVARTFSKLYSLAGIRVGYAVGDREVIDLMNRVREPFNVNSIAQVAAIAALKDQEYYKRILVEVTREREKICGELTKMGIEASKGATNFIQIRTPFDSRKLSDALLRKGIIVRDMTIWGLNNYIRVSIGTPAENTRFLKALKAVLG